MEESLKTLGPFVATKEERKGRINDVNKTSVDNSQNSTVQGTKFDILYTNCDTFTSNKKEELCALVEIHDPYLIILTEVNPKNGSKLSTVDLMLPNYKDVVHNLDHQGRGVAIICKDNVSMKVPTGINTQGFKEVVFIEISLKSDKQKLCIGAIYRSPNSDEGNVNALIRLIEYLGEKEKHCLLIGDFNFATINWSNNPAIYMAEKRLDRKFHEAVQDNLMTQHVNQHTRLRHGQNPTLDDLVLSSDDELIEKIEYLSPLGKSDHVVLIVKLNVVPREVIQDNIPRLVLARGDYEGIREELRKINWTEALRNCSTEEAWLKFKETLTKLIDRFIPKSGGKRHVNRKKAPYLNNEAMAAVRTKNKAWKKYRQNRTDENFREFARHRNNLRRLTREQKSTFEVKLASEVKTNPKAFWRYAQHCSQARPAIPELKNVAGAVGVNDHEKANLLNSQFASVFTVEPQDNIPAPEIYNGPEMPEVIVREETIANKLAKLNPTKSAGPDGLHSRVLKETAEQIAKPLEIIFKLSLTTGSIPTDWKKALVTPIYKNKGDKSDPANYRPISLTSVVCKVLESFIREGIIEHLTNTNLLSKEQHGFLPGKSCATNLIESMEYITSEFDKKRPVDILYCDFSKAFDKVPHKRLLVKMASLGISPKVRLWTKEFLRDRTMQVVVNGCSSSTCQVISGIPQGSVLGPTLFIVYVNDLPKGLQTFSNMLADDLKAMRGIANLRDNVKLQEDITCISNWCTVWMMPPNPTKCKILHTGAANPHHTYNITVDGVNFELDSSEVERDLGVYVDKHLTFHRHVSEIETRCNKILWTIKRNISSRSGLVIKKLYTTLVRPHIEYGGCALILKSKQLRSRMEKIQRRSTKLVHAIKQENYNDRLRTLNLPSIHYRAARGDMIQTFKYLKGFSKGQMPFELDTDRRTRGHALKLKKKRPRTDVRRLSYGHRIVNKWNALSAATVSADTINTFKNRLDVEWANLTYQTE